MEKIGEIIKRHRIKKGLTQEELGKQVFVSKQAVSKWENGRTIPDIETVRSLCSILEINTDEILGGSISEVKKSRKWIRISLFAIAVLLIASFLYVFDVPGYINRHTQSSVAYLIVFEEGNLLTSEMYSVESESPAKDTKNGYKFETEYGEVKGIIKLKDEYTIEYGFVNLNDWHNILIRIDIEKENDQLIVKQTISYETDGGYYEVKISENETTTKEISVYIPGI